MYSMDALPNLQRAEALARYKLYVMIISVTLSKAREMKQQPGRFHLSLIGRLGS